MNVLIFPYFCDGILALCQIFLYVKFQNNAGE